MRIDFLYWEECPSHEDALSRLQAALAEEGVRDEIIVTHVATEAQARALAFPGSPTIRLDGRDIQPETATDGAGRLTCRLYLLEDGRPSPLPSREMIARGLRTLAQTTKEVRR
ncbi:MAG TPA: thioredoxin family protein [bacterium]|jgi:hypothetical protein|nr:thioredoxin family protein [bacterium]